MALNPAESGNHIVENAKYVKINENGMQKLAKEVSSKSKNLIKIIIQTSL